MRHGHIAIAEISYLDVSSTAAELARTGFDGRNRVTAYAMRHISVAPQFAQDPQAEVDVS